MEEMKGYENEGKNYIISFERANNNERLEVENDILDIKLSTLEDDKLDVDALCETIRSI